MTATIPLIRAGALFAFVEWLEARGRPVDEYLAAAGVPCDPLTDPDRSLPLHSVMAFIRAVAEREDRPDLAWQVVGDASVAGLGALGRAAFGGATVAEGLAAVARTMPDYCTHETFAFTERAGGGILEVAFAVRTHPASLHHAQLYTLALVAAFCAAAHARQPYFEEVVLPPHPRFGLSQVPTGIARSLRAAVDGTLRVRFAGPVLAAPLRRPGPAASILHPGAEEALRQQARFLEAARRMVAAMVADGQPSAEILAEAAGITLRTLQRRLAAKGTSFTILVDEARREAALARIEEGAAPIGEIAATLGYSSPSSLTRAVRRWTDHPPSHLRRPKP